MKFLLQNQKLKGVHKVFLNSCRLLIVLIFSSIRIEVYAEGLNRSKNFWYNFDQEQSSLFSDLDLEGLTSSLELSPDVSSRTSSNVILEIPSYNGSKKGFRFFETSVLPLSLKIKYPRIKSYMGIGIDNPSHRSSLVFFKNSIPETRSGSLV